MPSRLLVSLAAAVAITWAIACSRGHPAPQPAADAPATVVSGAATNAPPPAPTPPAPEKPAPKPSAEEVNAIEHPHVLK